MEAELDERLDEIETKLDKIVVLLGALKAGLDLIIGMVKTVPGNQLGILQERANRGEMGTEEWDKTVKVLAELGEELIEQVVEIRN